MDPKTFANQPKPEDHCLTILWFDAKGDWDRAHDLADSRPDLQSAWLHAYLHRKEGDEWNAKYWYNRAGRTFPDYTLDAEWKKLYLYFSK